MNLADSRVHIFDELEMFRLLKKVIRMDLGIVTKVLYLSIPLLSML